MLSLLAVFACAPNVLADSGETGDQQLVNPGTPSLVATFDEVPWEASEGWWEPRTGAWAVRAYNEDFGVSLQVVLDGDLAGPGAYPVAEVRFSESLGTGGFVYYYVGHGDGDTLDVSAVEQDVFVTAALQGEVPMELTDGTGEPMTLVGLDVTSWPQS